MINNVRLWIDDVEKEYRLALKTGESIYHDIYLCSIYIHNIYLTNILPCIIYAVRLSRMRYIS